MRKKSKKLKKEKKEKVKKDSKLEKDKKPRKPRERKPTEGSRYASLVLFLITIVLSGGFYLYGIWSQNGVKMDINIDMGESVQRWEYSK